MKEESFKRCIGRTMEALEVAGIENQPLKQLIKGYLWDLFDDHSEGMKEGNNNDETNATREYNQVG